MTDDWVTGDAPDFSLEPGLDSSADDVLQSPGNQLSHFLASVQRDRLDLERRLVEVRGLLRHTDNVLQQSGRDTSDTSVPANFCHLSETRRALENSAVHLQQLLQKVSQAETKAHQLVGQTGGRAPRRHAASETGSEGCDGQRVAVVRGRPSWSVPLQSAFCSVPDTSCQRLPPGGTTVDDIQRQLTQIRRALGCLGDRDEQNAAPFSEHSLPPEEAVRSCGVRRERMCSCDGDCLSSARHLPSSCRSVHSRPSRSDPTAQPEGGACCFPPAAFVCHCCESRQTAMVSQCLQMLQQQQLELAHLRRLVLRCVPLAKHSQPQPVSSHSALNNQVAPSSRANNYWDNFRSYSRQNRLTTTSRESHCHARFPPSSASTAAAGGADLELLDEEGDSFAQRVRGKQQKVNRENQRLERSGEPSYARSSSLTYEQPDALAGVLQHLHAGGRYGSSIPPSPQVSAPGAGSLGEAGPGYGSAGPSVRRKQPNRAAPPPPLSLADNLTDRRGHDGLRVCSSSHDILLLNNLTPTDQSAVKNSAYYWPASGRLSPPPPPAGDDYHLGSRSHESPAAAASRDLRASPYSAGTPRDLAASPPGTVNSRDTAPRPSPPTTVTSLLESEWTPCSSPVTTYDSVSRLATAAALDVPVSLGASAQDSSVSLGSAPASTDSLPERDSCAPAAGPAPCHSPAPHADGHQTGGCGDGATP